VPGPEDFISNTRLTYTILDFLRNTKKNGFREKLSLYGHNLTAFYLLDLIDLGIFWTEIP
jgi:hypothetical protein